MKAREPVTLPGARLTLSALGLGCAPLGGLYRTLPPDEARAVVREAWSLGLRHLDTAPFYGYTLSEHLLGEAVRTLPRDDVVLSTKVGRLLRPDDTVAPGDDAWAAPLPFRPHYDYSHDGIMRSFEDSLQRLGVSRIDILYVHDIGRATHGDAHAAHWTALTKGGGFRALERLRAEGQIAAIGLGVNEWQVVQDAMQEVALDCTLLAGRYTLLEQTVLGPFLDACLRHGNAIVAGGVFNSGVLVGNGKFNYGDAPAGIVAKVDALSAVCAAFDVPLPAVALQFPGAHPAIVSCLVGAQSVAQLRQNVAWFEQPVPPELWQTLLQRGLLAEGAPVPGSLSLNGGDGCPAVPAGPAGPAVSAGPAGPAVPAAPGVLAGGA